jgi:hypothetical protein
MGELGFSGDSGGTSPRGVGRWFVGKDEPCEHFLENVPSEGSGKCQSPAA